MGNDSHYLDLKDYSFKETPKSIRVFWTVMKYVVLVVACLLVIIPLLTVLIGSFKTKQELLRTSAFVLPKHMEWSNYARAFTNGRVLEGLGNTVFLVVVICFGSIITGTMSAFVLQRFNMLFTRVVKAIFLATSLLPTITMQISVYQIAVKLHIVNSYAAPILLSIGTDIIAITIFIQFLDNISVSLDESAILDGCSYPRVYWSIILPMLRPAIATVLVMKFVGIYNDFYTPYLYMPNHRVVSTALRDLTSGSNVSWNVVFAGVIICIIPTLIMFLSMQKSIYSNLVSGSVKE